ncbi:MAG TPA: sigma-70 family RNA polymerase sigma factor [Drouetiella sp.]
MSARPAKSVSPSLSHGVQLISNSDYKLLTDLELLQLCNQKHAQAFNTIVQRYDGIVRSIFLKHEVNGVDCGDLCQEVYIRAWKNLHLLRDPRCFRAWLTQIATNVLYDRFRKRPPVQIVYLDEPISADSSDDGIQRDVEDCSSMPHDVTERRELLHQIDRALKRLPESFRLALTMREFQGLSYEEISTLTSSETGTVKSRISRARSRVRNMMAHYVRDCA